MSKKQGSNGTKERKIFLNSMNSWFSNFVIEEFRTDYLPDAKIKYEFMGTMNFSSHPLPRLFEPKETKIELGYNYNQEVFTNDYFIYYLDDSNLAEVDFIIRGLKSLKYDSEKTLILVSSIMTWGKTPQKVKTNEEIQSIDFNEEEFIPPKEEEEEPVKEEEKKEEIPPESDGTIQNPTEQKEREESIVNKEEEKKSEIPSEQQIQPNNSQISIDKTTSNVQPSGTILTDDNKVTQPQQRIFYYKESDYPKRIPNKRYFQYKILETQALSHNNPMLRVYIICPGFVYGCGEDFFFDYFKMGWLGRPETIPIIGNGLNSIPTIHIMDLVQVIRRIIEKKPATKYIFAVDRTKNPSLKNIIKSISMCMGSGKVQLLKDFNIDEIEIPNYSELSIDVKIKTSKLLIDERKPDEDIEDFNKRRFKWHCEFGIPENLEILRNEFNIYRNLKSVKILVLGPPTCGKSEISKKIANKLRISHLTIPSIIEWAKGLNNELTEEIKQKEIEIEEIVAKALEDYDKRKNKRKTDPPLDTTNLKKYPVEFLAKIIRAKLRTSECLSKGYILDGFPKKYQDCVELFMENDSLNKDIIPDSVIIISNWTEESLKAKLKTFKGYEENMLEFENRFLRRFTEYKANNEGEEIKKVNAFFEENNIPIFAFDDSLATANYEEEFEKMEKYLERDGPINNYERLCDEDEEEIIEEENKEPDNKEEKGDKVIEEHKDEEEEEGFDSAREENKSKKEEKNSKDNVNITNTKQNKSTNKKVSEVKIENSNSDTSPIPKLSSTNVNKSNNNEGMNEIKEEENEQKKVEDEKEQLIQQKLEELKEREKKLLEKKSEVLRRYLSENVIPLLAKGVLNVCQNMPDDPVEALANFLLDNSFEKLNKSNNNNSNNESGDKKVSNDPNNLENLNNNISNSSSNTNLLNKNISLGSNNSKLNITNSERTHSEKK